MLNILTIDLEDYFQVHAFSKTIKYEDWDKFECRIERNTDRLLEILSSVRNSQSSVLSPAPSQPHHCSTAALYDSSQLSTQNPPKGTFFVLGWIAERYPNLVRKIKKEGHEIACHGYAHKLIYTQSRDEFRQDIKRAKSILEDITGSKVIGYRAPSYSITMKSKWAFEVLVEEGFKYDSSVFPIHHDFYGLPEAPRFPFVVSLNGNDNFEFSVLSVKCNTTQNSKLSIQNSALEPQHRTTAARNNSRGPSANNPKLITQNSTLSIRNLECLIEFPLSTVKLFGQNVPISGGGYFRLFPYRLIRRGLKSINRREDKPFLFYIHPWELDPGQPKINGISPRSRFRHYVSLDKTEGRFRKLLKDFQFSTIHQFLTHNP